MENLLLSNKMLCCELLKSKVVKLIGYPTIFWRLLLVKRKCWSRRVSRVLTHFTHSRTMLISSVSSLSLPRDNRVSREQSRDVTGPLFEVRVVSRDWLATQVSCKPCGKFVREKYPSIKFPLSSFRPTLFLPEILGRNALVESQTELQNSKFSTLKLFYVNLIGHIQTQNVRSNIIVREKKSRSRNYKHEHDCHISAYLTVNDPQCEKREAR